MHYTTLHVCEFDELEFDGDIYVPLKRKSDDEYVMVDKETEDREVWHIDKITDMIYTSDDVSMRKLGQDGGDGSNLPVCPHGHGQMMAPINGDPLEPEDPYCPECGHILGNPCSDGCNHEGKWS